MRTTWLAVLTLTAFAFSGPLQALEAGDSMIAWGKASPDEKTKLVTELLKRDRRENAVFSVVKCLDAAASVPGHAELSIGQVTKACANDNREPV